MTVSKIFRRCGLLDLDVVKSRNMKLFNVSATSESVGWDIQSWGTNAAVICLQPGPTYKGFEVMLAENRIHQATPFNEYANVCDWFRFNDARYANVTKKYFPMRLHHKEDDSHANIRKALVKFGWDLINHDSTSRVVNIDNIMNHAPTRHTIILVKDFWRASKRINRKHVGGSYESVPKTSNTTSSAQSLIGRHADNYEYIGDELNPDLRPVHFGDKSAIIMYIEWFNGGCDFTKHDYKSARISAKDGVVKAVKSIAHHSNISGLDEIALPTTAPPPTSAIETYRIYSDETATRDVCKMIGHIYRPKQPEPNGFILTSLNRKREIASLADAIAKVRGAYGGVRGYRTYLPCYVDKTDPSTLRFVVIIRDEDVKKLTKVDAKWPHIRL
jgi:hypothetical protein